MYIKKVCLKNFQCFKEALLELDSGFNVLVGESNVGKTAILRALRLLFLNLPRGTSLVREGATSLFVSVETGDGHIVQRHKGARENVYIVDDQSFRSFGSDIPAEVLAVTKVAPVDIGDVSLTINFSRQLDPPFLLHLPDSQKGKLLLSLSKVREIDEVFREIRQEVLATSREIEHTTQEIEQLNEDIAQFNWLPAAEKVLEEATQLTEEIQMLEARIEVLEDLQEQYSYISETLDAMQERYAVISSTLDKISSLTLEEDGARLKALVPLQKQWTALTAQESSLTRQMESLNKLPEVITLQKEALALQEKLEAWVELQEKMVQIEEMSQEATLEFLQIRRTLEEQISKREDVLAAVGDLCPVCKRPLGEAVEHLKEWTS